MPTRRRLLQSAPALLAWGASVPGYLLQAAADTQGGDDRVLVVVQLSGGNDGLNTVVPFRHDVYRRSRPKLTLAADAILKIDAELGLHPALRGFAELLEAGRLAIVQGVGYPQPNRSHFESMDIWHTCLRKESPRVDGWLGRYADQLPSGALDAPALHLGHEPQPAALMARRVRTPSIRSLREFRLETNGDERTADVAEMTAASRGGEADGDLLGFVQSSAVSALNVAQRFAAAPGSDRPADGYPATELGQKLGQVARLILSGMKTRVYYVAVDGFDTHAQQSDAHAGLLRQLGDAVAKFLSDLAGQGADERVLVQCFSEFGRRVAENASEGTDHGAAAPMFLAGSAVRSGLIGEHPSLTDLDDGDLRHHTDFRQVYAAVLEDWLGCPSAGILGGTFQPVAALRRN